MRFLKEQDKSTVKEIDKSAKNKWSWKWTTESLSLKLSNNCETHYLLGDCIQKIDEVGVAWCTFCNDKIAYSGRGKASLKQHLALPKHENAARARLNQTQNLCSCKRSNDVYIFV